MNRCIILLLQSVQNSFIMKLHHFAFTKCPKFIYRETASSNPPPPLPSTPPCPIMTIMKAHFCRDDMLPPPSPAAASPSPASCPLHFSLLAPLIVCIVMMQRHIIIETSFAFSSWS